VIDAPSAVRSIEARLENGVPKRRNTARSENPTLQVLGWLLNVRPFFFQEQGPSMPKRWVIAIFVFAAS